MATTYDALDRNHDGVFMAGHESMTLPGTRGALEVHPLSSSRIQRAEGAMINRQGVVVTSARLPLAPPSGTRLPMTSSSPTSAVMAASLPALPMNMQPRVVQVEQASVSFVEAQTMSSHVPQAVHHMEAHPLPTDEMSASLAPLSINRRIGQSALTAATQQELVEQVESERNVYIRSMQESHTLQIRMLEELIEQKVNMLSNQNEDRFAHTEAYSLELKVAVQDMRRDLDGLEARFLEFTDMHAAREKGGDNKGGEVLAALGNIHSDIEAMRNQHRTALSAIQSQKEQHQHLHVLHEQLRQKFEEGTTPPSQLLHLGTTGEEQQHLQGELQTQILELRREATLLGTQQRQQGAQLQNLEAQVVQHLKGLKEQQQNEALLLRQDLEATLAANSHGEGLLELHRKYEDVSRAVEVALRELPPERQAAPSLDQLENLEAERQDRIRDVGELTAFLQEERDERIRIDEELDARQQQASEETYRAMNAAFDDFRAEMRALADQMLRQCPDRAELEGMVAKAVRPERDARAEVTRFLEAERGGRVQDLENERDARVRETTDLRSAIQRLSEKVPMAPDAILGDQVKQEVQRYLADHQESMDRKLGELVSQVQAAAVQTVGRGGDSNHVQTQIETCLSSTNSLITDIQHERNTRMREHSDLSEALQRHVARLEASHNQELESVRAMVEQLQLMPSSGDAQHQEYTLRSDLDSLAAALEAETIKRCEVSSDLHAGMKREAAEVASRIELLWQELQEALNSECQSRKAEMDALRAHRAAEGSASSAQASESLVELKSSLQRETCAALDAERAELKAALTTEHDARLRDNSAIRAELSQVMERERSERMGQSGQVRADFAAALAKERDERIAENSDQRTQILKMAQQWHAGHSEEEPAKPEGDMAVMEAEQPVEPKDNRGFISRMFRSSNVSEANART